MAISEKKLGSSGLFNSAPQKKEEERSHETRFALSRSAAHKSAFNLKGLHSCNQLGFCAIYTTTESGYCVQPSSAFRFHRCPCRASAARAYKSAAAGARGQCRVRTCTSEATKRRPLHSSHFFFHCFSLVRTDCVIAPCSLTVQQVSPVPLSSHCAAASKKPHTASYTALQPSTAQPTSPPASSSLAARPARMPNWCR